MGPAELKEWVKDTPGLRVGIVASNDYPHWGGSEDLWLAAAARLIEAGVNVAVTVPGFARGNAQVQELMRAGVEMAFRDYKPLNPLWRLKYRRLGENIFYNWFDETGADFYLISQGDNFDGCHWGVECAKRKLPYALLSELARPNGWPENSRFERVRNGYLGAVATYFVSQATQEMTAQQIACDPPAPEVVRNPYRVPRDVACQWPAEESPLRLATVGRLEISAKGHDVILEVFSRTKWKERPVTVDVFGEGPSRECLERLREMLGATNVNFPGFCKEPSKIWETHHALLLSSRGEGLPLVLVEAMMCNRTAIVTDVGGTAELLEEGRTGFIAPSWEPDLLDEALERAWARRADWRQMGEAAGKAVRLQVPPDPGAEFAGKLITLALRHRGKRIGA